MSFLIDGKRDAISLLPFKENNRLAKTTNPVFARRDLAFGVNNQRLPVDV